jgi:hypothetical protein
MSTLTEVREITFAQAINEALHEEMQRDEKVIILGEDVAAAGGVYKLTEGLLERFGSDRVLDTPISEAGIAGIGVGAAMTGMRPIVEIMFGDFLTLVMDQLVNQAAKMYYMSGGRYKFRWSSGRPWEPDDASPPSIRRACTLGSLIFLASMTKRQLSNGRHDQRSWRLAVLLSNSLF